MAFAMVLDMDIIQYIEQHITMDNIVEYISIILLFLVCMTFWGKSWIMEKIGGLSKKQEEHVEKVVEQARKNEKDWTNIQ